MIKYEIHKYESAEYGVDKSTKFVRKSELEKHKKNDWVFIRKKYFIITNFLDWWKPISFTNKLTIFGIILTTFLTCFFWSINKYIEFQKENLKTENALLKQQNASLIESSQLLNQRFHSLTLALKENYKSLENCRETLKQKNTSEK